MTSIREQFIDAVALELHRARWTRVYRNEPTSEALDLALKYMPIYPYDRDTACIWIGHLEHANGCTVEEIVRAAEDAEKAPSYLGHRQPFTVPAFATSLITEAIWKGRGETSGPSWFDEHAAVTLGEVPGTRYCRCGHLKRSHGPLCAYSPRCSCKTPENEQRHLSIPPLNLTYSEEK